MGGKNLTKENQKLRKEDESLSNELGLLKGDFKKMQNWPAELVILRLICLK